MPTTQQNRFISIKTALDTDKLLLKSFSLTEQLGRLFQIEAELWSESGTINFDDVVGHDATIQMDVAQKKKREFNGCISRMVQVSNQGSFACYKATIVPWLWFLTRTSDCRIFQQEKVTEIIMKVFRGHHFKDFLDSTTKSYSAREYCVQYRETDFNFISRLMEQEGIYYFFKHKDGKNTAVMVDSIGQNNSYPDYAEVSFQESGKVSPGQEAITDWIVEKEVQAVACALNDFDFTKPSVSLLTSSNVSRKYGKAEFEIFDYPGEYVEHGDGQRLADVRIQELQTQYETAHGQSTARGLSAGFTFSLKNHPRPDQNREYLITGVTLHADAGPFDSAQGGKPGEQSFSCSFSTIPKTQQFRPARLTPKPIIQGPQTAIVVGTAGQEVDPDEYGRVKVQFHWDRHGKADENASCSIRVAQAWAGGKLRSGSVDWGDMAIPHLGDEVIVEFLEGDPDRPIITGRVYNGKNLPPLALPANKHRRIFRDNFGNEIVMDATPGSEGLHLYSPKIVTTKSGGGADAGGDENGKRLEIMEGSWHEFTYGAKNELIFGIKQDHVIGTAIDTRIGGCFGFSAGVSAEYKATQGWEHGGESNLMSSHEDQIISAKETVSIVGGAGNKHNHSSLMNASEKGIHLSVGKVGDIEDPAPAMWVKLLSGGLAIAAGLASFAVSKKQELVPKKDTVSGLLNPEGYGIFGANVAVGVAYFALYKHIKKRVEKIEAKTNDDPKALIELSEDGQITINSRAEGILLTNDEKDKKGKKSSIEIKKAGDIEIRNKDASEKFSITDGYIDMVAEKRILIKAKGGDLELLADKNVTITAKKISSKAEIDFSNLHVDN